MTVGQTVGGGALSHLTITNTSDDVYSEDSFQVNTITVVPSCGSQTDVGTGNCDVPDVGVLRLASTGTGRGGGCDGTAFTITSLMDSQNKYAIAPVPPATVTLGPALTASSQCTIDYDTFVFSEPNHDSRPDSGLQTEQKGFVNGVDVTAPRAGQTGDGAGTDFTTIAPATIPIVTHVSPATLTLGATFRDTATLTPPAGAAPPTGPVSFAVYGPDNVNCSAPAAFNSDTQLAGAGTSALSTEFKPSGVGTYRVIATYEGDGNYNRTTTLCADALEQVVVTASTPPACTPQPGPAPPGGTLCTPPTTPACTPPPGPAPAGGKLCSTAPTNCTTPPGPAPAGGKLCTRGTAAIHGTTGCAGPPFRVVVRGREIERVVFTLDGKKKSTLTKPNAGSLYVLAVRPASLKHGTHHVAATTTFLRRSGTKTRTLRVAFSRCAREAAAPAFTG